LNLERENRRRLLLRRGFTVLLFEVLRLSTSNGRTAEGFSFGEGSTCCGFSNLEPGTSNRCTAVRLSQTGGGDNGICGRGPRVPRFMVRRFDVEDTG
jgi:hypothetical protein